MVYFDYNASTPIHPVVQEKIQAVLSCQANPSSLHAFGRQSKEALESAREILSRFISAKRSSQLIFTSGATEANNMLISSFMQDVTKEIVLVSSIEHPCVLEAAKSREKRALSYDVIPVLDTGHLNLEALEELLVRYKGQVSLVSVMLANNETGVIQDLEAIIECCHKEGVLVHSDCAQVLGRMPFDVAKLDLDFASFSAHKCYGPQGVGALYAKESDRLEAFLVGGSQEQMLRAGTQNGMGIEGFKAAIELLDDLGEPEIMRLAHLKAMFLKGLERLPINIVLNSPKDSLPNTLNVSFGKHSAEKIVTNLDLAGFGVATGAACSTGSIDPSPVLLAMGRSQEEALRCVRFSWGYKTQERDIKALLKGLADIV